MLLCNVLPIERFTASNWICCAQIELINKLSKTEHSKPIDESDDQNGLKVAL